VKATDWATVASLATALGTLILAVATFSAVRSANVMARVAQQSLLAGQRPVLMAARRDDPAQKVNFGDSTRFTSLPLDASDTEPEGGWLASQSRHWNIDRPDPRHPE